MRILKKIWAKWLVIAKPIGNFQAIVLLSIFYLVGLFIFGFIFKFFIDPLEINSKPDLDKKKTSFWFWEHNTEDINDARKPF